MLDGKQLPEDTYARNVLQRDLGIHPDLTGECLEIIKANGLYVGILTESNNGRMIRLRETRQTSIQETEAAAKYETTTLPKSAQTTPIQEAIRQGKVFLGYCCDQDVAQFVQSTLEQFGIPYGSPEIDEDDPRPVPQRTSDEMRESSAAILIIGSGPGLDADEPKGCQDRLMYLLGASSVLYGDRVVLFLERGLKLNFDPVATRCVEFQRGQHAEAGLALLGELHSSGIISVGV